MISFDIVKNDIKEYNPIWPQIPDEPYIIIIIIGGSGSGKINSLLNLINRQPDIGKIYVYAKDPYEAKYQFLIKKREDDGTKRLLIENLLLNIQTKWLIFMKTLKITIQIKIVKY